MSEQFHGAVAATNPGVLSPIVRPTFVGASSQQTGQTTIFLTPVFVDRWQTGDHCCPWGGIRPAGHHQPLPQSERFPPSKAQFTRRACTRKPGGLQPYGLDIVFAKSERLVGIEVAFSSVHSSRLALSDDAGLLSPWTGRASSRLVRATAFMQRNDSASRTLDRWRAATTKTAIAFIRKFSVIVRQVALPLSQHLRHHLSPARSRRSR